MQIVLLRTLNEKNGLVEGAVKDWMKPLITQLTQQLKEREGAAYTPWFKYSSGDEARLVKMSERAAARPDLMSAPDEPVSPDDGQGADEPTSMAEAILSDQTSADAHRAVMADAPRAQRGPGRPPKTPVLEPA